MEDEITMNWLVGPYTRKNHAHLDEMTVLHQWIGHLPGLIVDVGACQGSSLISFLKSGWRGIAFEPDPKNRELLVNNVSHAAPGAQVRFDGRAVSNQRLDAVPFYVSDQSQGIGSLSAFHESHKPGLVVETIPLSEALTEQELSATALLKIDAEGHDFFVLRGFPWGKARPEIVICEFEDSKTIPLGYQAEDMARYLVELGYEILVSEWHPIIAYGQRHDWKGLRRYIPGGLKALGWGNIIAVCGQFDIAQLIRLVDCSLNCPVRQLESIRQAFCSMRPIFIWGAGAAGRHVANTLLHENITPMGYIDSDTAKQGKWVMNLRVGSLDSLKQLAMGDVRPFVVISSMCWKEIERDLNEIGWVQELDYLVFVNLIPHDNFACSG